MNRRDLLAVTAGSVLSWPARGIASALTAPAVDRLELTVLIDNTTAVFEAAIDTPLIKVLPPSITRDYHQAFAGQWGYSLLARSSVGAASRTTLVDFGYTPEALLGNMDLLGVEPASFDAMVLRHGHYDHFGGLDGILATGRVRHGTPLFVGGEEAFCSRVRGTEPDGSSFGAIDRPALLRAGVVPVISGDAKIIASQGFTTGRIAFVSPERPRVPTAMLPGRGCERALLDPAKRDLDFVIDDAVHELGTAYYVAGRVLAVIGSCVIVASSTRFARRKPCRASARFTPSSAGSTSCRHKRPIRRGRPSR